MKVIVVILSCLGNNKYLVELNIKKPVFKFLNGS